MMGSSWLVLSAQAVMACKRCTSHVTESGKRNWGLYLRTGAETGLAKGAGKGGDLIMRQEE